MNKHPNTRSGSILWARQIMETGFDILDCETTGLGGGAECIQLTVMDSEGRSKLSTYVKPSQRIEPGAFRVHGISNEMLIHAPLFTQVIPSLRAAVSGRLVVAFNLDFDRRIIRQTCARYHVDPPKAAGFDCAMLRFGAFHGELKKGSQQFKWHSLNNACKYFNIERVSSHESLVDCRATLDIIMHMATAQL